MFSTPSFAVGRGVALRERRDFLCCLAYVVPTASGLARRESDEKCSKRCRGPSDVVRDVLRQVEHEVTVDGGLVEAERPAHRLGELVEHVHVSSLARFRSSGVSQSSHGTTPPVSTAGSTNGSPPNVMRKDGDFDQSTDRSSCVGHALHSHCGTPAPSTGTAPRSGWQEAASRSRNAVVRSGRSPASRTTTSPSTSGSPAATAAAGPACGGSSRTHLPARAVARCSPTTTTLAPAGSATSTRSSSDTPSIGSRVLSPPPIRRDRPPASTS